MQHGNTNTAANKLKPTKPTETEQARKNRPTKHKPSKEEQLTKTKKQGLMHACICTNVLTDLHRWSFRGELASLRIPNLLSEYRGFRGLGFMVLGFGV